MNLATVLSALPHLAPLIQAAPTVKKLVEDIVETFTEPADQATIREAIDNLAAENDEGHAAYQAKLRAAIEAGA